MILKLAYIKVLVIILLVSGIIQKGYSQSAYNLVPNYSFENHSNCGSSGAGGADNWYSPVNKTFIYSYANACSSSSCCGVPSNNGGASWQYARTGEAYVNAFFSKKNGYNIRVYLQTKLTDSLRANHCYYIEFYLNLFNDATYANNGISLLVGDTGIVSYMGKPAAANPQIQMYSNPIITDTQNWVRVGGVYMAHGGERFITIGNFYDDAHTDTLQVNKLFGGYDAAYYLDDVSVIPLDSMQLKADAGRDTTIVKGDSVWIGSRLCGLTNVVWYDAANNVIDTGVPGLWVKPTSNTFYVIEQDVCGQYSRDTVFVNVQPLPVSMLNFECLMLNERQVNVSWQTATEINVIHFNVQRSLDGVTFETVETVKSKGASKYSFIDKLNLSGVVFYRLEVVDRNGALSYSEIKQLTIDNGGLMISPNPATNFLTISGGTITVVRICDVSGRVLILGKEKKVDVRGLVSGVYYITINGLDGSRVVRKFVKR